MTPIEFVTRIAPDARVQPAGSAVYASNVLNPSLDQLLMNRSEYHELIAVLKTDTGTFHLRIRTNIYSDMLVALTRRTGRFYAPGKPYIEPVEFMKVDSVTTKARWESVLSSALEMCYTLITEYEES